MIDYFALALTHFLILTAFVRLMQRDLLDREDFFATEEELEAEEMPARELTRRKRRARAKGEASDA